MSTFNQASQTASPLQAFALEPILTPSGLLDTLDDTPDAALVELPSYVDPSLDQTDLDLDPIWDVDLDNVVNEVDDPEIVSPEEDTWIEDPGDTTDSEVDAALFSREDLDASEGLFIPFANDLEPTTFESGVFVVGDSGEIGIDYLFDGGGYEGELAIFSLDGMDEFEPGSEAFIQEAARRAASNSDLGHIVISDRTEGARFSGILGNNDAQDFNNGEYLGVKTFTMRPGDEFGVMLVPHGRVEQVLENPGVGGNLRPLFSLATNNPNDGLQAGQIVDVTGDGNTFVFEDLRLDQGSDRDYNDIIFQVRGAVGQAELMENWIDPSNDWRNDDLGQALIEYAKSYLVETLNPSFDAPLEDQPLIGIIDTGFNKSNPDLDLIRVIRGRDWIDGDENPLIKTGEGDEHGTFVAGIIGATRDNDIGIDGINDKAPLWLGRAVGSGQWANSLIDFVDAAQESGQPNAVVNLSFDLTQVNPDGSITTRYELTPQERAAIQYARQNNVLIVASSGNDGGVMSALGQASQEFDNIITVGAVEMINPEAETLNAYQRADYSSYGYGLDLVAPGGTLDSPKFSLAGEDVGSLAGTSVATAKVTGAASQVWAANPGLHYRQVIEILKSTAIDIHDPGWDLETGAGLLNMIAAVQVARITEPQSYISPPIDPGDWYPDKGVIPFERPTNSNVNFRTSMDFVARWEGGFVNHPNDLGGPTNKGITQATYNAYRRDKGEPTRSVQFISQAEVDDIYFTRYWLASGSQALSPQLALVHFDTAVNMGVGAATALLNQARQAGGNNDRAVVDQYLQLRENRYRAIANNNPTQRVFLQGWLNRNNSLRQEVDKLRPLPIAGGNPNVGTRAYVVRPGDTLWAIAQRELGNGIRWREIMKTAQGGTFTEAEARRLQIGQTVYLPVIRPVGPGLPVVTPPTNRPAPIQPNPPVAQERRGRVSNRVGNVPLNLRSTPNQLADLSNQIGQLNIGREFKIIRSVVGGNYTPQNRNDWYEIELANGRRGFVAAYYVDVINVDPPGTGNQNAAIMTQAQFNNWRNLPEYTVRNPFPAKGMNCTWYAHGRMLQLGHSKMVLNTMLGHAGTWDNTAAQGAVVVTRPQAPSIALWEAGVGGAGRVGHVAVVEQVNPDGSIVISESNWDGKTYNVRTIHPGTRAWPSKFITVPKA
jgi:surface antigen